MIYSEATASGGSLLDVCWNDPYGIEIRANLNNNNNFGCDQPIGCQILNEEYKIVYNVE